ncbi:alpha/beta fold hydrolase [Croceicoccus ponticola]|uniref:Alpha/beta fold hydrolase n=2 Tax=Croceicoccus ponticola TaxID=2217664 RepID=A0A437GXV6_9SPHN|nr:alpha/beta fold hydrolase [Croceicoccus ponticola]
MQTGATQAMFDAFLGAGSRGTKPEETNAAGSAGSEPEKAHWEEIAAKLNEMWGQFLNGHPGIAASGVADPAHWPEMAGRWMQQWPMGGGEAQGKFLTDSMTMWESVLGQMGLGSSDAAAGKSLPRQDRRFKDPKWQETPVYALLHQAYLLLSEQMIAAAESAQGLSEERKEKLRFFTRLITEAMSPAHFPLTNPLVLEKTIETGGENLVRGLEHLISDLDAGKLTHTDPHAFVLGENIAATPGKVVYETPLFQLIQYTPVTETVLKTPLLIFPPWINRFYILDLGAKKSFVKWAVEQGLTVCLVSWKSADSSMAEISWDDYIAAMIEAIDVTRDRFKVPSVHTIGYCVGGTTLAAALAVLGRRGEADKVASATYFTAQVDFSEAGELKAFIDEQQLAMVDSLAGEGFVDGRYLAFAFNLLRSPDLIWNYVIRNYLLGEDYVAFDLLHWNGDTTNLPARFHREYLKNLYHDNLLVVPDALSACGVPIDLRENVTPSYIQAGVEDHIAPVDSVWKLTGHLSGPKRFVLAGSGHIAGVVNPPAAGKYQYWSIGEPDNPKQTAPATLDAFREAAVETRGSWWPDWIRWIEGFDATQVKATGKRKPGGRGDSVIEDAPGRYVKTP